MCLIQSGFLNREIGLLSSDSEDVGRVSAFQTPTKAINQYENTKKINAIVSVLYQNKINTNQELLDKLQEIHLLLERQGIFGNSEVKNFNLLKRAVRVYSEAIGISIALQEREQTFFIAATESFRMNSGSTIPTSETEAFDSPNSSLFSPFRETHELEENLSPPNIIEDSSFQRIVSNYDQLELARTELMKRSNMLMETVEREEAPKIERLIIGCGDTALTLWLEEHRERHRSLVYPRALPEVLMVGKDFGSWRYNYTLAQRHAMLERREAPHQAADFVTQESYDRNRHVNARHLYQANQCNLADTNAPVLNTEIDEIEKHEEGKFCVETPWERPECKYRARIRTRSGVKYIYTKKIDICAGLGQATNPLLESVRIGCTTHCAPMTQEEFTRLSRFDSKRGCSPLVDGNAYVLSDVESKSRKGRSIIVYGGGGTAAACGRQGFHGDDCRGEEKTFAKKDAKNTVLWVARNSFDKSGTGTLATAALHGLERRDGLTLLKVEDRDGKLHLTFATAIEDIIHMECDQLIYSNGQTDEHLHPLLKNITDHPKPLFVHVESENDPVLVGAEASVDVRLLGAAADAAITTKFDDATWKFLKNTHVGGDVGPGSMPPTAGQLRLLSAIDEGHLLPVVSLNIDHPIVIKRFLDRAGVPGEVVQKFIDDVLEAREMHKPRGFDIATTRRLIRKYQLDRYIILDGHASLKMPVFV